MFPYKMRCIAPATLTIAISLIGCSSGSTNSVAGSDSDETPTPHPTPPASEVSPTAFTQLTAPPDPDNYLAMFGQRPCDLAPLDTYSAVYPVATIAELRTAYATATANSAIVWKNGSYSGFGSQRIEGPGGSSGAPITVRPETLGGVTFTGGSMSIKFDGSHTDYVGFKHQDIDAEPGGLIHQNGNFSKVRCNSIINLGKGSAVGIYGHDSEVSDNLFDGFGVIGIFQPSNNSDFTGTTPRLRNWHHHNTFRNSFGEGTPIMIGYAYFMPNGPTSDEDESGAIVEWNLFDGRTADPETISIKSGANVIRYNYFRDMHWDNHLSIRLGHNNLAYGNLFKMLGGGYATRTSGHNYQFLYNVAYGGGTKSTMVLLHGEIDSSPASPTYYAGHNGRYRKNILLNFTHFAQVLSSYRTDALLPPTLNVMSDNIWAQTEAPQYEDGSAIAPLSWFESNNTVQTATVMQPADDGNFVSRGPIDIDMTEVVSVANSVLGPITVDPKSIPWLEDFNFQ